MGNHAAGKRMADLDAVGGAADHVVSLPSDRHDTVRFHVDGHDGGFAQHDPLAVEKYFHIRSAEIKCDIGSGHRITSNLS